MQCGDLYYQVIIGDSFDLSRNISTLSVEELRDQPARLDVVCADPYKVLSDALREGMSVAVSAGRHDDHSLLFRGRIYRVQADFPRDGTPQVSLQAHDNRMLMGLRNKNRVWTDQSLEDIVRAIAGQHFEQLTVEIPGNPRFTGNGIRQQNETDLAFLLRLGREYGCEAFVKPDLDGDHFHFLSQRSIMEAEPAVTLYHGRSGDVGRLLSFQSNADISQIQLPRVLTGIDFLDGTPHDIEQTRVEEPPDTAADAFFGENLSAFERDLPADADRISELFDIGAGQREEVVRGLGDAVRVTFPGFTTAQSLRDRQDNHFSASRLGMQGNGAAEGNQLIRANRNIRIGDLGVRFSGVWYLTEVRHHIDTDGFRTEFQCQR
jgi:uncharacterized protein